MVSWHGPTGIYYSLLFFFPFYVTKLRVGNVAENNFLDATTGVNKLVAAYAHNDGE